MRFLLLILFSCIIHLAFCQDMNGIWRGKLTQEPGGCYPEYFIELQIRHSDRNITGFTYDYYDTTKFIKLDFDGRMNMVNRSMVLTEHKVLQFNIPIECTPCVKTYDLTLTRVGNDDVLTGSWNGVKMGTVSGCPPGNIVLRRVSASAFNQEPVAPEAKLAGVQGWMKVGQRKTEIVKTLVIDTSTITLQLYDNGQVDGDTISVYLNQQLILYKGRLATQPITLNVPVKASTDYEMIMYAENLGSIPPNTALMVVTVGLTKYDIYLSSSEVKSAAVRFRYEKKE